MNVDGVAITVAPPARARVLSPDRSDRAARCSDTSEEEQAVSIATAGPSKPNVYDTRPAATLTAPPVSSWPSYPSGAVPSREM